MQVNWSIAFFEHVVGSMSGKSNRIGRWGIKDGDHMGWADESERSNRQLVFAAPLPSNCPRLSYLSLRTLRELLDDKIYVNSRAR